MRIAVVNVKVPFVRGGAELLAEQLQRALIAEGHLVELIEIPFKWYPPESVLDHLLSCRLLDLRESNGIPIDLMIGLKFPAFHIRHPNKALWIVHQHRAAYDLWEDHPEISDLRVHPDGPRVCAAIRQSDESLLPEAKAIYTISENVSIRLQRFCSLASQPLYHPPPNADKLYSAEAEPFFFYPSRINQIKRQALIIEALAHATTGVKVKFAGIPDYPPDLDDLKRLSVRLNVQQRVEWLGGINDETRNNLYARAAAIVFTPLDEDYGYVTLEAMLSSKAVITCTDSGGPNEFVVHGSTGLSAPPEPKALAAAMDTLWDNAERTKQMGRAGRERYSALKISWSNVTSNLVA